MESVILIFTFCFILPSVVTFWALLLKEYNVFDKTEETTYVAKHKKK